MWVEYSGVWYTLEPGEVHDDPTIRGVFLYPGHQRADVGRHGGWPVEMPKQSPVSQFRGYVMFDVLSEPRSRTVVLQRGAQGTGPVEIDRPAELQHVKKLHVVVLHQVSLPCMDVEPTGDPATGPREVVESTIHYPVVNVPEFCGKRGGACRRP